MEGHIPMSEDTLWYGYLEAGEKSTPVVIDSRLNTGLPETVYVYNHARGVILEYKRAIAEPKLRELTEEEKALRTELRRTYRQVRKAFTPRTPRVATVADKPRKAAAPEPLEPAFAGAEADDYDGAFVEGLDDADNVAA